MKPLKVGVVRPNAGVEAWLRKRLEREIEAMGRSIHWWVRAAYREQLDRIEIAQDAAPGLYVRRNLTPESAAQLVAWAKAAGFPNLVPPEEMHVTVATSSTWPEVGALGDEVRVTGGARSVDPLGDKGSVVLHFDSPELEARWQAILDAGADWPFPTYHPHVSITYDAHGFDFSGVQPFSGDLVFGPEFHAENNPHWAEQKGFRTAEDARPPPADLLQRVTAALRARWGRRFDDLAVEIATSFARRAGTTTDQAVTAALRAAGMRVKFQITRAQEDQLAAAIQQAVALIRSIPEQHFTAIEGGVMRSVQAGRDLAGLTDELQATYGVTFRRASLIARDQNNKATAALTRTRQLELGIEQAQWVHSGAGKEPRPSHVKAGRDKIVYNVAEGWLDPTTGKRIWPGTEINCRCTSRSILRFEAVEQEAA